MMDRIDLSTAPSAMETTAAQWRGNGKTGCAPIKPLQPPRHRFAKPDTTPQKLAPAPKVRRDLAPTKRGPRLGPKASTAEDKHLDKIAEAKARAELQALLAPPEPDPARYAHTLSLAVATELLKARRCSGNEMRGLWQVPPTRFESEMMKDGLIGLIGKHRRMLTKLGRAVRAELLKDEG